MTELAQLRDQLLPAVRDGKQESADLGLDTHMHAVTIARKVADLAVPFEVDAKQLVDHIRKVDPGRTMTAVELTNSIAQLIAEPAMAFAADEVHQFFSGRYGEGKNKVSATLLWDLVHAGYTPVVVDAKGGADRAAWLTPETPTGPRADPTEVALAMTGARGEELTAGETEAVARGVSLSAHRRLYPAVAGELADRLAVRIAYLAGHLAAHLAAIDEERAQAVSGWLTRDPRSAGFRLALFEARALAKTEPMRRLAINVEWAMNAVALGREQTARAKLAAADAILA